ncbi:PAS domain S-box protein [Phormidesmis priestleyi ULC007]|uniref:Circadian input-output histidine kinase CikA n=1 Tax=Phormidesmis priestleyi ULC007 TaxID=1920490 RepID=A0A2T1DEE0_9CYAN|nr:PAS domain-containing protein [Phormidesmis priestleyi]PSB18834.1 PAS domain S-box protein [Phormidesmis priestleyi ULC007]PZO51027.1 MAG: PAS domain S-box protein [Phormidesmis priestleyi]
MNVISRTILIVDDSPEDRELYQRYLLHDPDYSYTILEASLGQQGLELWRQHRPDAVLLDYRLPDLDGLEFLAQLPSPTPQPCLPVVVVTGQGNEAIAVRAMKAGAQDYLVKEQITPEGLYLAVNGAIATVRLHTQLQQRIEREQVVWQITQKIHQSLNLDEILQTTAATVRQFLHTDRVLIFQLQPDGNGTVVAESVVAEWRSLLDLSIYDPCLAENYLRFSRPESVTHDVAFAEDYVKRYRQGNVTAIPDIHSSNIDPCHIRLLAQFQVQANLVVPILHDDHFWGLLIAHHCAAPRSWQALEVDLLKELAIQVSIALRQAELYQQAQDELAERNQVEAELRKSEERLRLAMQASCMGTWDWDIQTGTITWSDNLEALFGLEPGGFDGSFEMFNSLLHPDDRERVLSAIDRAITTGEDYNLEFRALHPQGGVRWALTQARVFYDLNGQPVRMAGIDLDITERKRDVEALQESETRFRQLAENIDAVFWIKEMPANRVSYVSPAYDRLWGLNPQAIYADQQVWVSYIHPADREWVDKAFAAKAAAGQFDEEYRIVLDDGRICWVHDRCFPLQNEAGEIYRFAGIAEDITDRKQAEQALQESTNRLRLAHKATRSGLWDWDMIQNKAQVSEEYCQLFGLDPATPEASYEQWKTYLHPDDLAAATEAVSCAVQQQQGYYESDYRILHPEGDRWIASRGQVFYDAAGNAVRMLGNVQDITDRKRLLEQERFARVEAERANRLKDEFLAVLSHELRSPLNPILGWAKLMQSRKWDAARTSEALATIERNAKLQCQLIDDLLDIAKILRGKLNMNVAPVDLVFVIESAIETVRTAAVAKSILLHSVLPQIGRVSGDSGRLQQIVWNLLSNAIKFTSNHGRVDIRLERSANQAQITVSDTGKGINPDFLPHVFDSFRQEDASTTRQYGGLGLGLAIVRQLVEAHGGTIAADSQGEGQGATFTVWLPLLDAEPEGSQSDKSPAPELDLTGIHVLIVDDEPDTRELLTAVLTQYGAEVLAAASAAEGLACLESFQPDVLISDIGMPEMDGYKLMQQIRSRLSEQGGNVPAIALTAYAGDSNQQQALAAGFQLHLSKPIDLEQLVDAISTLHKA